MSQDKKDSDGLNRYPENMPVAQEIHRAIHRMDQAWPILKPIVAVVTNWKAWAIGVGLIVFMQSEEIREAFTVILGALK